MTIQDSDITTSWDPPSSCSQQDGTLSLQVRLSHLLSYILTSIYKTEETHLGTFLDKTRTILHTLAGHAQEIEGIIYTKFQNAVDTMPKGTQHVTLLYHQCVIVATRPLLLSILKERLDKLDQGEEDWQSFLAPTKTLISTGIKSAAKTLQILSDEGSLLDVFLPFDLEFTYGAAIHLTMANALFPHAIEGQSCIQDAHSIFEEMTYKSNRLAAAQKSELVSLESLFRELASRIERRGLQTLTLTTPDQMGNNRPEHMAPDDEQLVDASVADEGSIELSLVGGSEASPGVDHPVSNMEFLENIGISSYEFLSIVDQIGNPETYGMLDGGQSWKEL
ncbi:hypothetical protein FE257_011484 [Aspergillus nanangensis]|uniref:Uncharacterized protein n=1 Tax=Aspergillus nanangensis TaxID=2582783 RepID=A0AAD4GRE3_ASPNN|nr:hypothetical protein FE257_011484 [Aspergillus nanangensis]